MTIAVKIVKVEVDEDTGKLWVGYEGQSLDCGRALNPMSIEGQREGGMGQSLGWGLWEQVAYAPDQAVRNRNVPEFRTARR